MQRLLFFTLLTFSPFVFFTSAQATICDNVPVECAVACDQTQTLLDRVHNACGYSIDFFWINYWYCMRVVDAYNAAVDEYLNCLSEY